MNENENRSTRKCSMCAEMIPWNETTCHYCGAKYQVVRQGYCTHCHKKVEVEDGEKCPDCGEKTIDNYVVSTLIEKKAVFNVVLIDCGRKKIAVIKILRQLTGMGLVEAKMMAENPGSMVLTNVNKTQAADAKARLEAVGGVVEIVERKHVQDFCPDP